MNDPASRSPPVTDSREQIPVEALRELEAIESQYLAALTRGRAPSVDEIVAAHPSLAGSLRKRLDNARMLHTLHHPPSLATPMSELVETRLPGRIGRYQILGELGEGAASVVLRAFDPVLDRPVAIKLLRQELPAGSDFTVRFEREARVVARLRHAHIVPVFDCGEFAGRPYLVMELVVGTTLDDALARQERQAAESATQLPLQSPPERGEVLPVIGFPRSILGSQSADFRRTADLIRKIAEALHFAHERGIIHRDVKPGNILLDERGEPQLADFGLALHDADGSEEFRMRNSQPVRENQAAVEENVRIQNPHDDESSLTLTHQWLGTPAYMSPEQAAGRASEVDRRSDVFSLGIVLYRMLTGRRPFAGNDAELRDQIIRFTPLRPRAVNRCVPRDLETICRKALEKDPADRYQTAQQMANELRRWLEDQPLIITPPPLAERCTGWLHRNRTIALVSAIAIVSMVGVTVAAFEARRRQRDAFIAAGAREEATLQRLLAEGHGELQGHALGRTLRVQRELLPTIMKHRRGLLADAPIEDIDCQIRSLFAASLTEFDLTVVKDVSLRTTPNLPWPAAIHPSGEFAVIASVDRPYRIDLDAESLPVTGVENRSPRSQVVYSPDGRWLAFSPNSRGVELWDGAAMQLVAKSDPTDPPFVLAMAFDANGETLRACCSHFRLATFAVPTLNEVKNGVERLEGLDAVITAAAFHPQLSRLAHSNINGQVFINDLVDDVRCELPFNPQAATTLGWSSDGALLGVGRKDGRVQVYDVARNSLIRELSVGNIDILGLCFAPDGGWVACGANGSGSGVWDVASGDLILYLPTIPCGVATNSPRLLGTKQDGLAIYDLPRATGICRLSGHRASIDQLIWSLNSRDFATIDNRFIVRIRDAAGERPISEFILPSAEGYASDVGLAVNGDGTLVATVHRTAGRSEFRISDRSGKCLQSAALPAGYDRLVFFPDDRVLSVRQEGCEFNRDSCRTVVREFTVGQSAVERGVLRESAPDAQGFFGHKLSLSGRYYIWTGPRLPRAEAKSEVWDLGESKLIFRIPQPAESHWGDPDVTFNERNFALFSMNQKQPIRFDLGERVPPVSFSNDRWPTAASPDGRYSMSFCAAGQMRIEQVIATGLPPDERLWLRLANRDYSGADGNRASFSPNGRYLAFGSQTGEITLVDLPLLKQKVDEFERANGDE